MSFSEHWSPKVVARLNDYEIKVVKIKGEFVWHSHEDTEELFFVVKGGLIIQLREATSAPALASCSACLTASSPAPWRTVKFTRS